MAKKRMLTRDVTNSDEFLDLSPSAKGLYLMLNMEADDDGFVDKVRRMIVFWGQDISDLRQLIDKRFVIMFSDDVLVIKHWKMHNTIDSRIKKDTRYQDELITLRTKKNKSYTLDKNQEETVLTSEEAETEEEPIEDEKKERLDVKPILEAWNDLPEVNKLTKLTPSSKRYKNLKSRISEYGYDSIIKAINNVRNSDFLLGKKGDRGWIITFDWLVLPSNFPKVLEGNYNSYDKVPAQKPNPLKEEVPQVTNSWEEQISEDEKAKFQAFCNERNIPMIEDTYGDFLEELFDNDEL